MRRRAIFSGSLYVHVNPFAVRPFQVASWPFSVHFVFTWAATSRAFVLITVTLSTVRRTAAQEPAQRADLPGADEIRTGVVQLPPERLPHRATRLRDAEDAHPLALGVRLADQGREHMAFLRGHLLPAVPPE